jgi:predicted RNase H-like nuclease (RuvC/YqgF family)
MAEQAKESNEQPPLIDTKGMPEWAGHAVTAIVTMISNYFISIKPVKDRVDELEKQLTVLREECQQLKQHSREQERKVKQLEEEKDKGSEFPFGKPQYLPTRTDRNNTRRGF